MSSRVLLAFAAAALLAGLAACGQGGDPGRSDALAAGSEVALDEITASGVTVGHPRGWEPCAFREDDESSTTVSFVTPDTSPGAVAPLSLEVHEDAGSLRGLMDRDRSATFGWADDRRVDEEPVEVNGARDATLVRFGGTSFGDEVEGLAVYALSDAGTAARLMVVGAPDATGRFEPVFSAIVDSIELDDVDRPDTPLPACDDPVPPARPEPETQDVPADLAGVYALKLTRAEADALGFEADDPVWWALRLKGDRFELLGATEESSRRLEFAVLEASSSRLVVEGSACDDPTEPMTVTIDLSIDAGRLSVDEVAPVCEDWLRDLLTVDDWRRTREGG